ncbi:AlpA family phage regulatory protein, partial [Candidatus Parcubacteria bacterium]
MPEEIRNASGERLLRLPDVLARVGVSKSTWWEWARTGKAPAPVRLSARCTVWRESDLNAWL